MLIPFKEMFPRQGINDVTGIMHVGAHHAQELPAYTELGIHNVFWVEADPITAKELLAIVPPHQTTVEAVVSDRPGQTMTFNRANNGQSSSLLELGTHETEHPDVVFTESFDVVTTTIDQIFEGLSPNLDLWCRSPIDLVNFLNLDIQGAELLALHGAVETLNQVKYIYSEVNEKELYKGCALLDDLDSFLGGQGFERVETEMTRHGWGDALYVRS